jgi:pimeloyl-ACP methyl ester carboxylesterase
MGAVIAAMAFPRPLEPMEFYEQELMTRPELIYLRTAKNESIPAVLVKANADTAVAPRMTIIYSHGNAEDLGIHLPWVDAMAEATGCDVLSYEYVGYSLSMHQEGTKPSEAGCCRSIDAAWRYATEELHIPPSQIILFGRSIGSGPTVDLAYRDAPCGAGLVRRKTFAHSPLDAAGVLLQSPIASGARVILGTVASTVGYPLDIFRSYRKVGGIRAAVAIMHGTADEVVPCGNGRALHALLKRPFAPQWMEGYGHNDMPDGRVLRYARSFAEACAQQ